MNKINLPKVLHSKTPKSYKNKKLNNANFGDFSHNDYQVFLHLISKIGGVRESLRRGYFYQINRFLITFEMEAKFAK